MPLSDADLQKSAQAVAMAYERYADRARKDGYRGVWSYVATKALSDWALVADLDLRGKRVLNVGCCEPIDELFFARQGVRRWVALDLSHRMMVTARDILTAELSEVLARRISLCVADAGHLPFADGTFDLVVSFSALEHIPDPAVRKTAFAEIARITRPEGHVAVTVPNRYSLFFFCHRRNMRQGTAEYGYSCLYSPRELRLTLLEAGLRPIRFQSEMSGVADLPSYIPSGRVRQLLRSVGYFGERIGYLAKRC
jgi:SAM-dependent methyltransferase